MKINPRDLHLLRLLCDTPTAPYHEQFVVEQLRRWHEDKNRRQHIRWHCDPAGNIHLDYHRGRKQARLLVLEAHLDHPALVVTAAPSKGTVQSILRGGVKPECMAGGRVLLWNPPKPGATLAEVVRVPAKVLQVRPATTKRPMQVRLTTAHKNIRPGAIGTWNLPDAAVRDHQFMARACDDLAGVAACLCVLDRLVERRMPARVRVLLTRAEEVGFAGAIAAAEAGWIPQNCAVIGLETSRATAQAIPGHGPVVRVGDRTSVFDPGLTGFLVSTAARLRETRSDFQFQRALMDGGTCDTTAFCACGYQAGAVCLALGNYHNMTDGPQGRSRVPTAGKMIASETIDLRDFAGEVELLTEVCGKFSQYQPDNTALRRRLVRMHQTSQKRLLYA